MTLFARVCSGWDRFFHERISAAPVALFRRLYGVVVILYCIQIGPDLEMWFGPRGITRYHSPEVILWCAFGALVVSAILLFLEIRPRWGAIGVFFCLSWIHSRNLLALYGGDHLFRYLAFHLMFVPDADTEGKAPAWGQRMLQMQITVIFVFSVYWKLRDPFWRDGTALWRVLHQHVFIHYPLGPIRESEMLCLIGTYMTFPVELFLAFAAWSKRLRPFALVAAAGFHLGLEYAFSIPFFEWLILALWCTFLDPDDLRRLSLWWHERRVGLGMTRSAETAP